jgi:hypothetical protein
MKPQETGEVALPPKQYDSDSGVRGDTEQSNVPPFQLARRAPHELETRGQKKKSKEN